MKKLLLSLIIIPAFLTAQTYEVLSVKMKANLVEWDTDLNSEDAEFAPYVKDDVIYFSSDRSPDVLLEGENGWSTKKVVNVFKAKFKKSVAPQNKLGKVGLISEHLVGISHTGTASFSETGDTLFFSQVDKIRNQRNSYPQLYYVVVLDNNRLSKAKSLPFNQEKYSFSHPCYDSNKKRLYFVSNRSGGKGGKDIFYSDLGDKGWSDVVSLDEINTTQDELFPFLADGVFYYSSYSEGKEKGLDIFWDVLDGVPTRTPLEGINTEGVDDFSLFVFDGADQGLFASDRNGNDDLFWTKLEKIVTVRNEMSGQFQFRNIEGLAAGVKVQIVDDEGFVLYETLTDENGRFVFRSIEQKTNYAIKAVYEQEEDLELLLFNQDGSVATRLINNENSLFVYRQIGGQQSGTLSLISEDMIDFELNQGHLTGQVVYENEPLKYPNDLSVVLVNGEGVETHKTLTDAYGNFDFKELSMSENYLLKIPDATGDMVVLIYDLKGNVVAQLKTGADGLFVFKKIQPEYGNQLTLKDSREEEEAFNFDTQTIWGYFEYDNLKGANRENMIVRAYSEDGVLVSEVLTDEDGTFRFRNLPPEKTYLFQLEENGENFILDDFTLNIYDRVAQKIAVLKRGQDGYFTFRPLGYDLDNQLSEIEQENMDFIFSGSEMRERILVYFDSNQEEVKSSDKNVLKNLAKVLKDNSAIKVEINAYADARSSDEYNLILSQKRGNWIQKYLSSFGIDIGRVIVNAYGEARLADQQNDALNRRAEIHLY